MEIGCLGRRVRWMGLAQLMRCVCGTVAVFFANACFVACVDIWIVSVSLNGVIDLLVIYTYFSIRFERHLHSWAGIRAAENETQLGSCLPYRYIVG